MPRPLPATWHRTLSQSEGTPDDVEDRDRADDGTQSQYQVPDRSPAPGIIRSRGGHDSNIRTTTGSTRQAATPRPSRQP